MPVVGAFAGALPGHHPGARGLRRLRSVVRQEFVVAGAPERGLRTTSWQAIYRFVRGEPARAAACVPCFMR